MATNPFAEFVQPDNPFAQFVTQTQEQPARIELRGMAEPDEPGALASFGRRAASLADVTVGGVLPAAAQLIGYPLARVGRTPEEAQAMTQRLVSRVEQPFGKAFGVAGTPEYQTEAGRQLMNFIGQNVQKGAKWISEQTGLPVQDVESYLGSAAIAAPTIGQAAGRAAAPLLEQASMGVRMPFEPALQARRERMSMEDYARGPQIDAAAEAQRLGLALNPVDIQPSLGSKATATIAGPRGSEALARVNKKRVREIALNELGLPPTTELTGTQPFSQARTQVAAPYNEVRKLPTMAADEAVLARLNELRPDQALIGSDRYAKAMNAVIDDAVGKVSAGLTGEQLLKNVQSLRQRARKTYNNKSADLPALDMADTNLAIANTLETMIESNIFNPRLLSQFRDARQKMAKTYAYEGATDFNTGMVDVGKLGRITAKDNALTGDIAALGKVAGNFPDVFTTQASAGPFSAPRLARSGVSGGAGALYGSQFGVTGTVLGGLLGSAAGEAAGALAARRMASPGYQAGLTLRDMRIPEEQVAALVAPIPRSQAIVPYETPIEVLAPGEGPYRPNFVMRPEQYGPRVTTPGFAPGPAQLPAPSAQGTLGALRAEDVRRAQMSRELGQQAEAQAAAAQAAARQPTRGGVALELDPITGRLREASQGVRGATPETFSNFGAALEAASAKVTAGRRFDLTAAEKVAWDRTRVDLAEVAPGFKTLSDKALAEKMLDREWVAQTATKARERAAAFEQLAARSRDEAARRAAAANRERMLDLAEQMEDSLRAPRSVSQGAQGPKTRQANRERFQGLFTGEPAPGISPSRRSLFSRE
jgi:hypothetical protein